MYGSLPLILLHMKDRNSENMRLKDCLHAQINVAVSEIRK